MSSAISTDARLRQGAGGASPAPQSDVDASASTLRPWHLFVLGGLAAASAGVILARGSSPTNIIFISLAIFAASATGIAMFRMLAPLTSVDEVERAEMVGGRTRAALEREKMLVLRSIKELEFDRAMNKVSYADFHEMAGRLRQRAAGLIKLLDGGAVYRQQIERDLGTRLAVDSRQSAVDSHNRQLDQSTVHSLDRRPTAAAAASEPPLTDDRRLPTADSRHCVQCGTRNDADARFCKSCGQKLAAALVLLVLMLVGGGQAAAQVQMPDPRQMSGIPMPTDSVPDRTVSVRVIRGQLSSNIPNQAVELHGAGATRAAKTDENGRALFSDLPAGATVSAVTVVDGERLASQEFQIPARGGIRLMLVASDGASASQQSAVGSQQSRSTVKSTVSGDVVMGGQSRIVVEFDDDAPQVYYLLDIINSGASPVALSEPLTFELPPDAQNATILEGSTKQASAKGRRVTVSGPFQPGTTKLQVAYQLKPSAAARTIAQRFPRALQQAAVVVDQVGGVRLTSEQLSTINEMTNEGRTFIMGSGPQLAAGRGLVLRLDGLPHRSSVPLVTTLFLSAAIVGVGLWLGARRPADHASHARRQQLESRRDKLMADLVRLEQQKRAGRVDADRYVATRADLLSQLERVYGELDTAGAPPTGEGLAA